MNDGLSYIGHKIENSFYTSGSQVASIRNNNWVMLNSLVETVFWERTWKPRSNNGCDQILFKFITFKELNEDNTQINYFHYSFQIPYKS